MLHFIYALQIAVFLMSNIHKISPLGNSGAANAKLVAQRSKGMPVISISLTELVDSAASAAIANLSIELYKAFNNIHVSYREGCIIFFTRLIRLYVYVCVCVFIFMLLVQNW